MIIHDKVAYVSVRVNSVLKTGVISRLAQNLLTKGPFSTEKEFTQENFLPLKGLNDVLFFLFRPGKRARFSLHIYLHDKQPPRF